MGSLGCFSVLSLLVRSYDTEGQGMSITAICLLSQREDTIKALTKDGAILSIISLVHTENVGIQRKVAKSISQCSLKSMYIYTHHICFSYYLLCIAVILTIFM